MNIDEAQLIKGIFQHELKNRFRCIVRINGKDELCYVPSSCRLSNFIDLEGKAVLLTPSINSITLPLTLLATAEGRKATILNLSVANEVVFEALNGRRFSFLGKRTSARREVLINGYKADVYIEDTHTAMEIKTIISSQKNALFPSVKSERSLRQLERIKLLLEEGYNVCYTFVSLSPRVRSIELDRASAFYPAFLACVKKGMSYYGCSLEYRKGEIGIAASIEVIIQALDSFFLKAKVVDDRNVEYNGVIMSLTALAKQLSGKKYAIAGPKFFKYKGEWLNDRRQRLGV